MKKRARIVSGLAALVALFFAPLAEASLTRSSAPAREAPALALTLAAPEPSEFSLFDGTEIARALDSRPVFDLISITTDESPTAARTRFVSSSELSADELPEGPELVPITSVREQRFNLQIPPNVFGLEPLRGPPGDEASYPKTRYRVFGLLGTPILGELRGVSLELHWRSASFSCGLSSGTVGWLSQDPMEDRDSPNLYGFVGARPHEKTDPLGLEASLANNGTIVIADVHTGRIRRISPAEIAANGDAVRAALGLEAGLDPREADAMMKRAGGGVWTNNARVTALSKGVSEEVDREVRFVAKTYAILAVGAATGGAASAVGYGAAASGAIGGLAAQATKDKLEGTSSSVGTYAGAALGGAVIGKLLEVVPIGEGPSTLGIKPAPPYARNYYGRPSATVRETAIEKSPTCPYCARKPSKQLEHIYAQRRDWGEGGWLDDYVTRTERINNPDNLTGACATCNPSKGAKPLGEGPGEWWPPAWPPGEWWPYGGGPPK
jgi:hypothetical protein